MTPQDGGLLPARPLAAQAHALRAAAAFIERAGIPGLSLTVDDERITIQVPAAPGRPAAAQPRSPGWRPPPAARHPVTPAPAPPAAGSGPTGRSPATTPASSPL